MSKKHPTKSISKLKTVKVEAPKTQPEETISTGKAVAHEAPATEVAAPKSEAPATEVAAPKSEAPATEVAAPKSEAPLSLQGQLDLLRQQVLDHGQRITNLESVRKRKAVPNGKVKILDKITGEIYPSKNGAYQTLLKTGELKELVDKGLFGADPIKNTFGWYALVRAWPERFEEMKADVEKAS